MQNLLSSMTALCTNNTIRVIQIVDGTIVDGPGLRTSIYMAGCRHACPGCHNPQSWPFDAGEEMDIPAVLQHIEDNGMNVTLTGGDPMYQAKSLLPLCQAIKATGKTIWCYTGFTYEDLWSNADARRIMDYTDVLVDGPFVESLRDLSLRFRGSSNQRLIDVARSTIDHVTLWNDN